MNPLHLFHVDTFLPKPGRDASGRKKCLLEALSAVHPISSNMRQTRGHSRPPMGHGCRVRIPHRDTSGRGGMTVTGQFLLLFLDRGLRSP